MLTSYGNVFFTSIYSPIFTFFEGECHECGDDIKHPTHDEYKHGQPQILRAHRKRYSAFGESIFQKVRSSKLTFSYYMFD